MSFLWPQSGDPPDRVLVAARSSGPLIDRWTHTTHCFIHLLSWMDPTWARKEAHELVLLAAYLARRDDEPDFWDVLRVVIVEYLSAGIPAYFDWLVDRDETTHEVIAAMRRLPVRDQLLLCLYVDDGRTSRHEEGRFRSADLALLLGIEPASVRVAAHMARQRLRRQGSAAMSDELDALRAPVPIGVVASAPARTGSTVHPAIDASSVVAVPPPTPVGTLERAAPVHPREPLGILDPHEPSERVLIPTSPHPARRPWLAGFIAATVAACAVGFAVYVGRDDRPDGTGGVLIAGATVPPETVAEGAVRSMQLSWGPGPSVCPPNQRACYVVAVTLDGYAPARVLHLACVVPDRPTPDVSIVTVGDTGDAIARLPCAENRAARAIDVTVDGEVAGTLELPTRIVPTPTVTFTDDRSAVGRPGCTATACRYVDVTLTGFDPGAAVTVSCHGESVGSFSTTEVSIGVDGTATQEACSFGHPGDRFWVEADGVSSETVTWPPD